MLTRRLVLIAVLGSLAGCAARSEPATPRRDHAVITREELQATHVASAYELIQGMRPAWLRARGTTSLTQRERVIVYVNEVRMGGVDVLRQLRPETIDSIRYLNEVQATARHGSGHSAGAIIVTLLAGI